MTQSIIPIDLGGVNGYRLPAGKGFILVDTGIASKRAELEKALDQAGCRSGNLKLLLTAHRDIDHTENGAYLQANYSGPLRGMLSTLEWSSAATWAGTPRPSPTRSNPSLAGCCCC